MTDDFDKKLEEYKLEIEKAEKEEAERRRIAEEERKRKAEEEEKEKEEKRKAEEERKRKAEEEEEEKEEKRRAERLLKDFNSGVLAYYNCTKDFEKVLKAGHTPTYASCVGKDEIASNDIIKLACEHGLSKDDATKLLQKCVSIDPKYIEDHQYGFERKGFIDKMQILIKKGHADVSKCSLSNIRAIYDKPKGYKTFYWTEHTGRYVSESIADGCRRYPEEITHSSTREISYSEYARDMFVLLLKSGYKPETLADKKDFVYLYTHVKDHIEKLEQEERKQQETKENFEKGIYYINLEEGKPVGKCKAPLKFTNNDTEFSMLSQFNDTFSSKAKEIENLEGIVDGNFGKDGFSGNITATDGDISLKVQYKDGKMHGVYKELDSDGTVIIEKYYENGVDVTEKHNALKRIAARKIEREEKLEATKLPKVIKKIGKKGFKIDSKIQASIASKKAERNK